MGDWVSGSIERGGTARALQAGEARRNAESRRGTAGGVKGKGCVRGPLGEGHHVAIQHNV